MLYIVTQYYTSYYLDYKEKLILKKYDIFRFFDIRLFNSQIKKFEEVLSEYLVLMKLNGYDISYQKSKLLKHECDVIVKFNGNNIGLLYGNKVLSLDDIFDIKYIIENNFRTAISYDSRFYFKTYNDAKNFLKEIKKQSDIFGI